MLIYHLGINNRPVGGCSSETVWPINMIMIMIMMMIIIMKLATSFYHFTFGKRTQVPIG
jgi:hypothetical protein